jgi:hypothetical protein
MTATVVQTSGLSLGAMLFGRTPMSMLTGIHAGEHGTQSEWNKSRST